MKTLLERSNEVDEIVHQLQKVSSRMHNGRFFDANRELCRIIAALQRSKAKLLASVETERLREAVEENDRKKELDHFRNEIRRLEGLLADKEKKDDQ